MQRYASEISKVCYTSNKNDSATSSIILLLRIYETAPKHFKHYKIYTGHVTLPYLRCDHIIPEINTRVTLSHERRAVGAAIITD